MVGVVEADAEIFCGSSRPKRSCQSPRTVMPAPARGARSRLQVSSLTASESRAQPAPLGAEALAGRDRDTVLSEQPLGGQPSGSRARRRTCPRATGGAGSAAMRRSRRRLRAALLDGLLRARRARQSPPPGAGGRSRSRVIPNRFIRSTTSAFPTTKPIRHPGHPVRLRHEYISTPTSLAPAREEALGPRGRRRRGRRTRRRGRRAPALARTRLRRRTCPPARTPRRVRGVVEVDGARLAGRRGEVGRPACGGRAAASRVARPPARRPRDSPGSPGRGGGPCRRAPRAPAELDERGLCPRHDGDLALGVDLDAVHVAVARAIASRSPGSPRNGG